MGKIKQRMVELIIECDRWCDVLRIKIIQLQKSGDRERELYYTAVMDATVAISNDLKDICGE